MFLKNLFRPVGLSVLSLAACQQQQVLPEASLPVLPSNEVQPAVAVQPKPAEGEQKTPPKEVKKRPPLPLPNLQKVEMPSTPFVPKPVGRRVARVEVPGPYVALTFDDGPSPSNTPKILDILKRHGAHATFFVAGENAVNNKKILARAAAEGNEIGAHTYSHIKMTASGDEKIASEMSRTNAIIEAATGRKPVVMRPPYGATNQRLVNKMYDDYGMSSILWDVDTQDWRHPGVEVVVRRAVGNARPGSIILVHDIHASTLAAVEDIVTGLQARGFKLVTVSRLMALGGAPSPATPAATPAAPETPAEETPAEDENVQREAEPAAPVEQKVDEATGAASISVGETQE